VIHPGFKGQSRELIDQALATGDAALLIARFANSDDIALLKLRQPVTDVTPAVVYRDIDEFGRIVKIIGKGATGTGATGFQERSPRRTELRRAFNKITSAHDRWFCYVFDHPSTALPLEGVPGSGDSGGPALIEIKDQWLLAGLVSWGPVDGDARAFRPGLYGRTSCNVRLSYYADWIAGVMSAPN
jgi:hypothetical protein